MKKVIILISVLLITKEQKAQWTTGTGYPAGSNNINFQNIGIGTSTPNALLHVTGEIRSQSNNTWGFTTLNTGGNGITGFNEYFKAPGIANRVGFIGWSNNDMRYVADLQGNARHIFETAGLERMRINANGNVGIGTTNPGTARLNILGTGLVAATPDNIDFITSGRTAINSLTSPGTFLQINGANQSFYGINNSLGVTNSAFGVWTPTVGWNAFNIMNNGNVGIGLALNATTTVAERFQVANGNILLDDVGSTANGNPGNGTMGNLLFGNRTWVGVNNKGMRFSFANTADGGYFDANVTDVNDGLIFRVDQINGGTERMRINANGNVGIGATTPVQRLDVNGSALFRQGNGGGVFARNQILFGFDATGYGTPLTDLYQHSIKTRHDNNNNFGNAIDFYLWNRNPNTTNQTAQSQLPPSRHIMTIAGNGKVGILTQSPQDTLHVQGTVRVTDLQSANTGERVVFANANGTLHSSAVSTSTGFLRGDGTWQSINTGGTGNMTTSCTTPIVNSVPRMTGALTYDCGIIRDDNTNVGIGTGITAPTDRLDINGTARVQTLPAAVANENVVMANTNGQLHRLAAGPAGTFLSNNGTFQAIPAPAITNVITSPVGTFDNQLNTTVNGVTSNTVNIIKSNTLTTAIVAGGVNITSTVNGATTPNVTMATTFIPIPAANPGNDWHVGGNMIATPATEYIGTNSNNDFNIHTFAGTTGANRRAQYTADGNYDFGNNTVGLAFNTVSSAFGRNNVLGNTRNSMAIGGDNTLENDSNDIVSGRNNILTNTHQSGAIGQSNTIENSSSIVTLGQGNIVKNSNQSVISGEDMNLDGCHGCFMGGGHSDITGLMPHHLAYNMIVGYFDTILKSDHSNAYGNLSKIQYGRDNFSLGNNNSISDARRSYTIGNSNTIIGGDTNFVFGNKLTSTSGNTDVFLIGNNIDNNVSNSLKIGFKNNRTMHIGENGVGIQMDPTNPLYTPGHNLEVDADPTMSSNPGVGSNIMFRNVPIAPICDGYDRLVIAANGEIFRRTNCDDGGGGAANAWLLGGNSLTAPSYIGTNTTFDFDVHTNNIYRARYTIDGNYMLGTNTFTGASAVSSAFGGGNTINGSSHSLALGSANNMATSDQSFVSGSDNTSTGAPNSGIIGSRNSLTTIDNSVVMGEENTLASTNTAGIIGKSNSIQNSYSIVSFGEGNAINNSNQGGVLGEDLTLINSHGCFIAGGHSTTNGVGSTVKSYNMNLGGFNLIDVSKFSSILGQNSTITRGERNNSIGNYNQMTDVWNSYTIGNNLTANNITTDGVFLMGENITNDQSHSIKMGFNNNRTLSIHERGVGIQMNPTNPTYTPNHNLEVEGGPNAPALNSNIQFNNLPSAATAGIPPASLDNVVIASNGEIYRAPLGVGGGGIANTCITQGIVPRVDASGTGNLECSQIYDDGIGGALGGGVGIDYVGPFAFTGLGAWLFNGGTPLPTDYKLIVNGAIEATIVVATSDENAKTKIEKIENASEKINLLNGKSYYWNEETMKESKVGNTKQLGFLAQEVEKVLPEAVVKRKDGKYGLQYNAFIPVLVESQKSIIAENKELKSKNEVLESKVSILEEKFALLEKSLAVLCENGCGGLEKLGAKTNTEVDVLYQSIPNPTDDEALINYYLTREYSDAYITVSTQDGKMIQSVKLDPKKGNGSVKLTLGSFASGTYLYTLVAGERVVDTKRLQILK